MGKIVLTDHFEARTLTGIITVRPWFNSLFLSLFFPESRRNTLLTDTAAVELEMYGKELAPFVTDYEGGTLVENTKREVQAIKTTRMRPKKQFRAADLLKAPQLGRDPYNPGAPRDRILEAVTRELDDLKDRITKSLEWMAAQAMQGGIVISQDNIQRQIDFLIPASNKVTLTGTDRWTESASDPSGDFEEWNALVQESGFPANVCVMGDKAWTAFRKNPAIKEELDNKRIELGQLGPNVQRMYKGRVNGIDIYHCGTTYTDGAGVSQKLLAPNKVLFTSTELPTSLDFGLPADLECSGPVDIFSKSKMEDDPSGLFLLAESRPMPWPKIPNGIVIATVVDA
ncbi:major capsid protein [Nitratidesulfovibrio vulgaris]|uniref:Major head protein n=1 Tax=Nitratidesulfovibrio vulgaris (strain DP4) TaxID=391774 RepID=A0A0H3A6Y0_NITV4|nr:major capsid protein [Nitratidesulfovibrio vulgaris]ABM28085.1 major head protein [Nitratidesulfovibrio vulgaris DP4]